MTADLLSIDDVAQRIHKRHRSNPFDSVGSEAQLAWAAYLTGDESLMPPKGTFWRKGDIYFIAAGDFVKIGFTTSPVGRIRSIKTATPLPLKILHHQRGTMKQERELHRRFAAIRVRGEWFRKTPELLDYIEEIKKPSMRGAA